MIDSEPTNRPLTRRDFVTAGVLGSAALAAASGLLGAAPASSSGQEQSKPEVEGGLPKGRIGKLQLSRLMFGGNITSAWMHARDLGYVAQLARHYNTDQKILETFALAESQGIDTAVGGSGIIPHIQRYRRQRGGKMKLICWLNDLSGDEAIRKAVDTYVEAGVDAIFVNGAWIESLLQIKGDKETVDLIGKTGVLVKQAGLPFGVGAHGLRTVQLCEAHGGAGADFYFKTLHHHNYPTAPKPEELVHHRSDAEVPGYWCHDPKAVIDVMQEVKKPWIAFKILAAGAIAPSQAFRYAFHNGADFICVGMFDFQVEANCRLAIEASKSTSQRKRPSYG
jgi:hypothetical protein